METFGLIFSCLLTLILSIYLIRLKDKNQLQQVITIDCLLSFGWCAVLLVQKYFCAVSDIDPIWFDYFAYIFICTIPIAILFTGIIFANTKISFNKKYLLLFVIPVISLIMLYTNNYHHLFYVTYSINTSEAVTGNYFYIHSIYSFTLQLIGFGYLLVYSIKNSGIFSKQAILFCIAILLPMSVNILATLKVISITIYVTPICFSFSMLLIAYAVLKLDMAKVTPIALQRIVDRISDGYVVLNEKNIITDFNRSFLATFKLKAQNIRNTNFFDWDKSSYFPKLKRSIASVSVSSKTSTFEAYVDTIDKYFNVEVSSIVNKGVFLGTLILFKDITQHIKDLETIHSNQDMLIEKERFASLGQMIGGIAHNLKTPIMSIAGATEALTDLVNEYDRSIGDPEVTNDDHHDIAKDMTSWISKIKSHTSYMSDIITAVKGQAVETTDSISAEFTVGELVKRVNILMKHELKHSLIELNLDINVDENFILHGDVNCLVQVVNNLISNAIQSYNGAPDNKIDFIIEKSDNSLILSIQDYGCGMTKEVQDKLFKEMITTKGKNGTGLGLFMSYSNIKAHFNGTIDFKSKLNHGSTFSIILPCD